MGGDPLPQPERVVFVNDDRDFDDFEDYEVLDNENGD